MPRPAIASAPFLLLAVLLPVLLAFAAPAAATGGALAEGPDGPLVTAARFAEELERLPPPARAELTPDLRRELLETLVGRLLVEREVATGPAETSPVFLARLIELEAETYVDVYLADLRAAERSTGETDLRQVEARVEARLEAVFRDYLKRHAPTTGEVDLFFGAMLGRPDGAIAGLPLFAFADATPMTLVEAYGVADMARIREGATDESIRRDRALWLDRLLKQAVIRRVTREAGIQRRPAVSAELARRRATLHNSWYVAQRIPEAAATPAEVRAFYDARRPLFTTGGYLHAELIQAPTKDKAAALRARIAAGEPFDAVAREASTHASASGGGKIPPFRPGADLPDALRPVGFMKDGELSNVIATKDGFFLVRRLGAEPETTLPFEEVRDRIRLMVEQEKSKAARIRLFGELKKKYGVVTFPERDPGLSPEK